MTQFHCNRLLKWSITALTGAAFAAALVGCGGSGSAPSSLESGTSSEVEETELMISLTDAEGDFLTYAVDVTSISLNRANGSVIEILTEETTVDFAQYVDISELLAVHSVPVGRYESVSLNVDFTDAQIIVQSESGAAIEADVVDADGMAVESISVQIDFGSDEGFVLSPRVVSHITLDFDLDASNTIEVSGGEATVVVNPIWIADTTQEDPKPMRLRGVLAQVDETNASFDINVRPFRKQVDRFGENTVYVGEETEYEVNGELIDSTSGLASLAELEGQVPVIALGSWDRETQRYTATEVLAGSSVPWAEADIVRGTVVARSGNEITVRGALIEVNDGRFAFNDDFTLLVGDATRVLKRGEDQSNLDDISVGSALRVVGTLLDDQTLDASAGTVRVMSTSLSGRVVSVDPLQVDLAMINGRRAGIFDFTGTGTSSAMDADADNYEIFTGALSLEQVISGDPVRVLGFVREFGFAPEDFDATTVIDVSQVQGVLVARYAKDAGATPIRLDDQGVLHLDLESSRSAIVRAGIPVNLEGIESLKIDNNAADKGIYSIAVGRRVAVFMNYDDFLETLADYLEQAVPVVRFTAQGEYDSLSETLFSKRMQVHFIENDTD